MKTPFQIAEWNILGFLVPWSAVIWIAGFVAAWAVFTVMEHRGWTRFVWHVPLFFIALVVLFSCMIGWVLAP